MIDCEFAFYGPMAFDIGKFIANLLLAYFAVDGHATADRPRWLCRILLAAQLQGVDDLAGSCSMLSYATQSSSDP